MALLTRRQLTELIAMETMRLKQALDPLITDSHRAVIAILEAACAEVETALEQRIAVNLLLART